MMRREEMLAVKKNSLVSNTLLSNNRRFGNLFSGSFNLFNERVGLWNFWEISLNIRNSWGNLGDNWFSLVVGGFRSAGGGSTRGEGSSRSGGLGFVFSNSGGGSSNLVLLLDKLGNWTQFLVNLLQDRFSLFVSNLGVFFSLVLTDLVTLGNNFVNFSLVSFVNEW
ncbi:hypothetical protein WICPIJ_004962 [Wickerhamomyces pijperi]|uniref:Uncharacterized protein n=1 Tax=Wickerhamomyces pijperi TaxID=599730 RepID=A0A9P8Q6L2_WICPI|nr:hypothetical protein WICPIJ_004962 [Wickerhamomyces pijperi]